MGYIIEVSFNILRHNKVTKMTDDLKNIALEHCCSDIHDFSEMENETRYTRKINHIIVSISFDSNINNISNISNISNILDFIQKIKNKREYHIECIYTDDIQCSLIYASAHYLTMMEKQYAKEYISSSKKGVEKNNKNNNTSKPNSNSNNNNLKRERSYSEDDIQIRKLVGIKE